MLTIVLFTNKSNPCYNISIKEPKELSLYQSDMCVEIPTTFFIIFLTALDLLSVAVF